MDLARKFGRSDDLVKNGAWVETGEGGSLLIAPLPNPKYDAFMRPHRKNLRFLGDETLPEEIYEEAIARHVLLDWKNMYDEGEALEASYENRLKMLHKYEGFKRIVFQFATSIETFQSEVDEHDRKNSVAGPNGSSGSAQ